MSKPDLDAARRSLEELRAELVARDAELSVTSEDPLVYDDNFADSAQVAAELGENQVALAATREQLDEIDAALQRLDEGTFGVCETCGRPIAAARLEALPATRFCIDHA